MATQTEDLIYPMNAQPKLSGINGTTASGAPVAANTIAPTDNALAANGAHSETRIRATESRRMCIPLVSGFLNMDKYIPLIMMNAGFTIELTLCDANRSGLLQS